MANQEHLDILAQGVEAWNSWRKNNSGVQPNFYKADLQGANLRRANLQVADLQEAKLEGAKLQFAKLEGAGLQGAKLEGAKLQFAKLEGAGLQEADLQRVDFQGIDFLDVLLAGAYLQGADLQMADFHKVDLRGVKFMNAILAKANFEGANLMGANFEGANLMGANLHEANLHEANLRNTTLAGANFSNARVSGVKYDRRHSYKGIRVDSCYGSQMFKSHAMDQDYIEEFRSKSKLNKYLYYIWLVSSDCGRSMLLWSVWSAIILGMFSFIYYALGKEQFIYPDIIWGLIACFYFSFATFSTLGFGDIHPVTSVARILVMLEVMVGYIMLGGLISILANKMAKRA